MGRSTREVTTYACDYCRLEQGKNGPWFGFSQGRNIPFTFSGQYIFCKTQCAEAWLTSNGRVTKLDNRDMDERFPYVANYHVYGNTD